MTAFVPWEQSLAVFLFGRSDGTTFEFCAPLALVNRPLRMVIVPGLFFMLLGFGIIIGTPFPQWLAAFVFWVPWDDLTVRRLGLSREWYATSR